MKREVLQNSSVVVVNFWDVEGDIDRVALDVREGFDNIEPLMICVGHFVSCD